MSVCPSLSLPTGGLDRLIFRPKRENIFREIKYQKHQVLLHYFIYLLLPLALQNNLLCDTKADDDDDDDDFY